MTDDDLSFLPLKVTKVGPRGKRTFDPDGKRRLVEACRHPGVSISGMALKAAVEANSFRAHFAATQLIFHTLDEQLWARGAAALMLRDVYSAPWTSAYQEEKK